MESPPSHVADNLTRQPGPYTRLAQRMTIWSGSPGAVVASVASLSLWIAIGALTGFPKWWEIGITVGLSFVTVLMLILIQHTQNHDDQAVQLKLDELIRANTEASNRMMGLEKSSQSDMDQVRQDFEGTATS